MEIIILSFLLAWGAMRYAGTEFMAAARGTESPRIAERRQRAAQAHERAMTRMAQRTTPTVAEAIGSRIAERIANPRGPRPPGPAREAIGQWWADSWGYATERRRHRHERAEAGDLGRQRAARAAKDWLRDQRTRTRSHDEPERVRAVAEGPHDEDIVDAEIVDEHHDETRPDLDEPLFSWAADSDGPRPEMSCPDCKGTGCATCAWDGEVPSWLTDPTVVGADAAASSADAPAGGDTDPCAAPPLLPDPAALPAAVHDQHHTDGPMASVHPIRGDVPLTTTEHTMTSGETLDPAAASAFVEGIRDLAQRVFTEIELSVSTLSQAGVTGELITLLQQMQEATQLLVSNSESAKAVFDRHIATQDVVLSDDTLAGSVAGTYVGTRS